MGNGSRNSETNSLLKPETLVRITGASLHGRTCATKLLRRSGNDLKTLVDLFFAEGPVLRIKRLSRKEYTRQWDIVCPVHSYVLGRYREFKRKKLLNLNDGLAQYTKYKYLVEFVCPICRKKIKRYFCFYQISAVPSKR